MLSDREDEPTSVDDWLRGVGEFGPYQRRHFAIVTSAWFFLSSDGFVRKKRAANITNVAINAAVGLAGALPFGRSLRPYLYGTTCT